MIISAITLFTCLPSSALAQSTERVSLATGGGQSNGDSYSQHMSANGRFVAFQSDADNLVPGDTNGVFDIFHRDLATGVTTRVSVSSSGFEGNKASTAPHMSADGRFITFQSNASNLVGGDTNSTTDVFVHDTKTGVTELVSQSNAGVLANDGSYAPRISETGRFVVFPSNASNLTAGDSNGTTDVYLYDRDNNTINLISKSSFGFIGNGYSTYSDVSADGRYVTFGSSSSNLVPADTNGMSDQFLHDTWTGITTRVSLSSSGLQANEGVHNECSISADGRIIVWASNASNLVSGDTNDEYDVFAHDRTTGVTERVSVHTLGTQGDRFSLYPAVSADGRFVAFYSDSTNLIAGDLNAVHDCFVHDRLNSTTQRVSLGQSGNELNAHSAHPSITADGKYVAFSCSGDTVVSGDTNGKSDVFVRDRAAAAGNNTIILVGPHQASVGDTVQFQWYAAPASSTFWFAYSLSATGSIIAGHSFDLGPATTLGSGLNSTMGSGFYNSAPLPPAAAGLTVYLEAAAMDGGGQLYDSYVRALTVI